MNKENKQNKSKNKNKNKNKNKITFTKMHGTGNDYVYVDCFENEVSRPEELAIAVSCPHFGIGADGLILIKPSDVADCFMDMYNADGSRGKMCGNGIRCVAAFFHDKHFKLIGENLKGITVETLSGVKKLEFIASEDGSLVEEVKVDMGEPIFEPELVPFLPDSQSEVQSGTLMETLAEVLTEVQPGIFAETLGGTVAEASYEVLTGKSSNMKSEMTDINIDLSLNSQGIEVDGRTYYGTVLSMGNPHFVIFLDEHEDLKEYIKSDRGDEAYLAYIEKIGRAIENNPIFPEKVNIEFIKVVDSENLDMEVWERGSGRTLACGTGACAALVASVLKGRIQRKATVHLPGGRLGISWNEASGHVFMSGNAVFVYEGSFYEEDMPKEAGDCE